MITENPKHIRTSQSKQFARWNTHSTFRHNTHELKQNKYKNLVTKICDNQHPFIA